MLITAIDLIGLVVTAVDGPAFKGVAAVDEPAIKKDSLPLDTTIDHWPAWDTAPRATWAVDRLDRVSAQHSPELPENRFKSKRED